MKYVIEIFDDDVRDMKQLIRQSGDDLYITDGYDDRLSIQILEIQPVSGD